MSLLLSNATLTYFTINNGSHNIFHCFPLVGHQVAILELK